MDTTWEDLCVVSVLSSNSPMLGNYWKRGENDEITNWLDRKLTWLQGISALTTELRNIFNHKCRGRGFEDCQRIPEMKHQGCPPSKPHPGRTYYKTWHEFYTSFWVTVCVSRQLVCLNVCIGIEMLYHSTFYQLCK